MSCGEEIDFAICLLEPPSPTLESNLQPEAAYFCHVDGKRGGYLVANLEEGSELVTRIEPFFLQLGAEIETFPVMNADELGAGLQGLGQSA